MSANGRLGASELTRVQGSMTLEKKTAAGYAALKAAAKKQLGRTITIAPPGGAYRSWSVQDEMRRGSQGNVALAHKWNLNPHSRVALATPGMSSHGWGSRVDIVGTAMDVPFLALAARHGFTREFGAADPNHFKFDGRVVKVNPVTKILRKISGRTTTYTVRPGDTAINIAGRYHISLNHFADLNPKIKRLDQIRIGQKVRVA